MIYRMGSNFQGVKISCFSVFFNLEIFMGIIFRGCCVSCIRLEGGSVTRTSPGLDALAFSNNTL